MAPGSCGDVEGSVPVSVTTDKVALAVGLVSAAEGYFHPNYFLAKPGTTSVCFVPFATADPTAAAAAVHATTRIEHLSQYTA